MSRLFACATTLIAIVSSTAILAPRVSAGARAAERYSASAINTNNGSAGNIDITIQRWSTDAERDRLLSMLRRKGPEKLLDALQDTKPVGHYGAPGNLSWDLRFARRVPTAEGGERVVLITDRPIGFAEAVRQPRSVNYPFTVIELRLSRDGTGEGKMSTATKIIADDKNHSITLENYELQPVQLTNVKRESDWN